MNLADNGNMPFAVDRRLPRPWAPQAARLEDTFASDGARRKAPAVVRAPRLQCRTAREAPRLIEQLVVGQELEVYPRWADPRDVLHGLRAEDELRRDARRFCYSLSCDRLTVLVERVA